MLSTEEEKALLKEIDACGKIWDEPVTNREAWEKRRDAINAYSQAYLKLRDNNLYPLWNPSTRTYILVYCRSSKPVQQ